MFVVSGDNEFEQIKNAERGDREEGEERVIYTTKANNTEAITMYLRTSSNGNSVAPIH